MAEAEPARFATEHGPGVESLGRAARAFLGLAADRRDRRVAS